MPGLLLSDLIHNPESSDITGKLTYLEKKFAFKIEFPLKDFPVSLGLGMFNFKGEIFIYFFDTR